MRIVTGVTRKRKNYKKCRGEGVCALAKVGPASGTVGRKEETRTTASASRDVLMLASLFCAVRQLVSINSA